ncbi:MAG TPA: VPLPA-CTERM sorting domain-containing protein [Pseudolabrys sp.]|nr:VPLPA-CTERM sorting domain-containing protein [Pseudolabrys sp.]
MSIITGAATLVGSTSPTQFGTMVYIDGTYYAGTATNSPYRVMTFDPNTADVLTSVNSNSNIFWGLAPVVTPLPAALPLFVTGLGALGLIGWRRKKKAAALAA